MKLKPLLPSKEKYKIKMKRHTKQVEFIVVMDELDAEIIMENLKKIFQFRGTGHVGQLFLKAAKFCIKHYIEKEKK